MAEVNPGDQIVEKEVDNGGSGEAKESEEPPAEGSVTFQKDHCPENGKEAEEMGKDTKPKGEKVDAKEKKKQPPQAMKKQESEAMRQSDTKSRTRQSTSQWPDTIEGFGYEFNEEGILQDIKTGGPFEFAVSENHTQNQRRYEALGEIITEKVYELLETKGGLKKVYVPKDASDKDPRSFIFVSDDLSTNEDKMLVLIHGSGVVRAGQWTRKLIINNSLDHGTQLPFIKSAKERGYSVVVLNTNLNSVEVSGKKKKIPKNGTPEEHTKYVWKTIISNAPAKKIAIVAHSFGGVCVVDVAREFREEFKSRVFAIAFTDSVHMMSLRSMKKDLLKHFENVAINWSSSEKPLDTPLRSYPDDARRVSAGNTKHEWTSYSSYTSIFKFLDEMYETGTNSIGQPPVEMAEEVKADDDVEEKMDTESAMPQAPATTQSKSEGQEDANAKVETEEGNKNAEPQEETTAEEKTDKEKEKMDTGDGEKQDTEDKEKENVEDEKTEL